MYNSKQEKDFNDVTKLMLDKAICDREDLQNLRSILRYHEWKYYIQNNPTVSDYEYDRLYKKLEGIESLYPELITLDSPTQRVASDLVEKSDTVAHLKPMLSLANSYNAEDLSDFDKQIKRYLNMDADSEIAYTVEPKYDGGSISVIYKNDIMERSATRGNGTKGEEMTANAKTLPSIPLKAEFSKYGFSLVELRGEAIIRKDNFEKINATRLEEGHSIFANPRNAATGGLRMKDPNETRKRGIEVFIFQLGHALDNNGNDVLASINSHYKGIEILRNVGFKVPNEEIKLCRNISEAVDFCKLWEAKRASYPYEIDGMVVKVNSLKLQERCGDTQHHPRWAIAYKFKAKQATTILEDVEYQVGKTGSVTPVAKVKPVQLAGVTISSISMHNEEFICARDLHLGDHVLIERAGDVIPYIVKAFPELRDGSQKEIDFPTNCPSCDTLLVKPESEAAWRCPNHNFCEAQILQRMIFHVSKDAMDIDGFGKSYIERFYKEGWLPDISEIYNLDYDKIANLEGFGKRSAVNLEAAINKAKSRPVYRLLNSFSIHHLGNKASKIIAQNIKDVIELKNWTVERFIDIKDIGPVVAENVISFFSVSENLEMLHRLRDYGVNMLQTEDDRPVQVAEDAPFIGKSILFTGKLHKIGRKEGQQLAVTAGAKNLSAVSAKLDILVVGEKAGSKLKKAQALGTVEILSEDAFLELLGYKS